MKPKRIAILALTLIAAGCSSPVDPDDENNDVESEVYYDVQVNLWRLEIDGDCDPNLILGFPDQGEFSYKVDVAYEDEDGNEVVDDFVVASSLFGNPQEGKQYKRNDGESIEFSEIHGNNVSSQFTAREGSSYEVRLSVIEWDGNDADGRMRGDAAVSRILVDEDGVGLGLGTGTDFEDCHVSLRGNALHARSSG